MQFEAEDHLAGQQLQCPNCGGPLAIPNLASSPVVSSPVVSSPVVSSPVVSSPVATNPLDEKPSSNQPEGAIDVQCGCGAKFRAAARLAGSTANCLSCGIALTIPLPPLAYEEPQLQHQLPSRTLGGNPPRKSTGSDYRAPLAIGGAFAVVFVVIIALFLGGAFSSGDPPANDPELALAEHESVAPTESANPAQSANSAESTRAAEVDGQNVGDVNSSNPANSNPVDSNPPGGRPLGSSLSGLGGIPVVKPDDPAAPSPAAPTKSGDTATTVEDSQPPAQPAAGPHRLFVAAEKWRSAGNVKGVNSVVADRPLMVQYSWMTALLPHLGHQKLYDRIDQSKPWTDGQNLVFSAALIPQFQNPADDRKLWKGYPFDGMGLSHFVGMAGIEDRRNVVAGELPRDDPRAGVFGFDEVAKRSEITDGESQTILLIGAGKIASPWVQGGGATIRGAREPYFDKLTGFGTANNGSKPGSAATMVDGSVRFISADIDPQVMRALCTIHGSESVDLSQAGEPMLDFKVGEGPAAIPVVRSSSKRGR
jgi:hypothetical protein